MAVNYNVITKNISEGLNDNEIQLGDGNYLMLQYDSSNANVRVRLNNNLNPQILLRQNSGIEAAGVQKIYVSCDKVEGGSITFLHGKNSDIFRYIPPTFGKMDIGTVDEIFQLNQLNLLQSFSVEAMKQICNVLKHAKPQLADILAANIEQTNEQKYYYLTEVLNVKLRCDSIKINVDVKPPLKTQEFDLSANNYQYVDYDETYIEVWLGDILVLSHHGTYQEVFKVNQLEFNGVRNKKLIIKVLFIKEGVNV
jgi:hypothetical protein